MHLPVREWGRFWILHTGFSLIMSPTKMAQRLVGQWATDAPHANPAAAAVLFISHKHKAML